MSLRKAIDVHCKACIYDAQEAGNWRMQVTACGVYSCALWDKRPLTKVKVLVDDANVAREAYMALEGGSF